MSGEARRHLRPGDYARVVTSGLFVVLGTLIVVRAALMGVTSPNAYLMGAAIAGLGGYRLWLVKRVLSRAGLTAPDEGTNKR
jgi:hypothetical protein